LDVLTAPFAGRPFAAAAAPFTVLLIIADHGLISLDPSYNILRPVWRIATALGG
jgi:hypothetical protein